MIGSHGLTDEAGELSRKIIKAAIHALPVASSIWINLVSAVAIASALPTTSGRLGSCWYITFPRQTTSASLFISGVGHLTLDAYPGRKAWWRTFIGGFCSCITDHTLTTSPTIALPASCLLGRYYISTAGPVLSPIDAVITLVISSSS